MHDIELCIIKMDLELKEFRTSIANHAIDQCYDSEINQTLNFLLPDGIDDICLKYWVVDLKNYKEAFKKYGLIGLYYLLKNKPIEYLNKHKEEISKYIQKANICEKDIEYYCINKAILRQVK